MSARKRVLIIRHPQDAFERVPYVVRALADEWRRRDIRVDVICKLDEAVDSNAIVIPHLDLTRTPPEYQSFLARCPHVVNRNVTDISKRRISRNLVKARTDYDGQVIVKTNRNAGGFQENKKLRRKGRLTRKAMDIVQRLPWKWTGMLGPMEYRIYDHPRLVPWPVWHNPWLVVEKFLPERHGELYCLRQYVFFGTREINTLALSPEPIVKAQNVTHREVLSEAPAALREIRASLGFDFGKFDYVMRDGQVVLFDANRTPTYNAASKAGSPSALLLELALGIEAFGGGS